MSDRARALFTAVALFMSAIGANAQQPTPPAGSPGATKPLSGQQLPAPPTPFGGKIERNAAESTPYWAPRVVPPKGAPNVLLVMIDDEGYGASSTFGRRDSDAGPRPHRGDGAALHAVPLDGALLADARRVDHWTQSPFDGLRRRRRAFRNPEVAASEVDKCPTSAPKLS
jgi:hypothetical protein